MTLKEAHGALSMTITVSRRRRRTPVLNRTTVLPYQSLQLQSPYGSPFLSILVQVQD